jgi:hypothetical protein
VKDLKQRMRVFKQILRIIIIRMMINIVYNRRDVENHRQGVLDARRESIAYRNAFEVIDRDLYAFLTNLYTGVIKEL